MFSTVDLEGLRRTNKPDVTCSVVLCSQNLFLTPRPKLSASQTVFMVLKACGCDNLSEFTWRCSNQLEDQVCDALWLEFTSPSLYSLRVHLTAPSSVCPIFQFLVFMLPDRTPFENRKLAVLYTQQRVHLRHL